MTTPSLDDYSPASLDQWWESFEVRDGFDYAAFLPQAREHARIAEAARKSLEDKADRLSTFVMSLASAIVAVAKLTPVVWWQTVPAFVCAAAAAVCCLWARRAFDWHAPTPMRYALEKWKPKEVVPRLVLSNAFAYYDARHALEPRAAWLDLATTLAVAAVLVSGLLLIPGQVAAGITSSAGLP